MKKLLITVAVVCISALTNLFAQSCQIYEGFKVVTLHYGPYPNNGYPGTQIPGLSSEGSTVLTNKFYTWNEATNKLESTCSMGYGPSGTPLGEEIYGWACACIIPGPVFRMVNYSCADDVNTCGAPYNELPITDPNTNSANWSSSATWLGNTFSSLSTSPAVFITKSVNIDIDVTLSAERWLAVSNSGIAVIAPGALFTNNGVMRVGASGLLQNNGTIKGTGIIKGAFTNNGTVGAGKFTISGNYTATGNAIHKIEIAAPNSYDQIKIEQDPAGLGGNATLDGALYVSLVNGYTPSLGNTYKIFKFASRTGAFSSNILPALPPGLDWDIRYNTNDITLKVVHCSPDTTAAYARACGSYTWNGLTYTSSGTYSFKTLNVKGCDSTAILHLTMVNNTPPVTPIAINGPGNVCAYIGTNTASYTVQPVPANVLKYRWTLPNAVNVVSAAADSSVITVSFAPGFTIGSNNTIKVKAIGCSHNSADKSLTLSVTIPPKPGGITATSDNACLYIGSAKEDTFRIKKVANTTAYLWTVPAGATLASHPGGTGINDTIVTVTFDNSIVPGTQISVLASAACGTSVLPSVKTVVKTLPSTPGAITGPTEVCALSISPVNPTGTPAIYTIRKIGAPFYNWIVPAGAVINEHPGGIGTANDTIIKVTFSSGFVKDTIRVTANNGCGASNEKKLTVSKLLPAAPAAIYGDPLCITLAVTDICTIISGGTGPVTYAIKKVAFAAGYEWSFSGADAGNTMVVHPNGPGINDTVISVSFAPEFTTATLSVKSVRDCGSSSAKSLKIFRKVPARPGVISGPVVTCPLATATYFINKVLYATSYTWTVPAGVIINTHPGGEGTATDTSLKVTFNSNYSGGSLTVRANVNCGSSSARYLYVSRATVPSTPESIYGPTDACPLIGTANTATYSLPAMPANAASVFWKAPNGATIQSGQGALSITVSFDNTFINGNISVQGVNNCGAGNFKNLYITKLLPETPGAISSAKINDCPARVYTYSVTGVSNATSYLWTVPSNAIITNGQGAATITVSYNSIASGSNDSLKVRAVNNCALSGLRKLKINLAACAASSARKNSNAEVKTGFAVDRSQNTGDEMNAQVMPNPSHNRFRLVVHSSNSKEPMRLRISDITGRIIESLHIADPGKPIFIGSKYRAGIYFAEFVQGNKQKIIKLIRL